MHIVVDARMIDASGIGVYLKNILNKLVKNFQVTLLGDPHKLVEFGSSARIITIDVPIYSIKEQLILKKAVPECDIFWSPHYNVPLLPVKAKRRLTTIHDVYHLAFYQQLSLPQKIYSKLVLNAAVRLNNKIITVSNFSKEEIIKYTKCPALKINVIHNGVQQAGSSKSIEEVRQKYNLPLKYILFIGNVKPHKNLFTLLKAYNLLSLQLQQEYQIVIAGKKDGFITGDSRVIEMINNTPLLSEKIILTGHVDDEDLNTLYAHAALFVFPSLYEGFGLPPLEAMANGCPVISSNAASLPEICGNAALYFDPLSDRELAEAITEVLSNSVLKQKLIIEGTQQIKNFSWQKSAQEHVTLFENLLN